MGGNGSSKEETASEAVITGRSDFRALKVDYHSLVAKIRAGHIDDALAERSLLASALPRASKEDEPGIRALAAQLHLIMMDRHQAIAILEPYVIKGDGGQITDIRKEELDRLASPNPYGAALVMAQLATLLYRSFRHAHGAQLAYQADRLFEKSGRLPEGTETVDRLIARCQNKIWWARLAWRQSKRSEAEQQLAAALDLIENAQEPLATERGGLDLVAAIVLTTWASFDHDQGKQDEAKRKIYRALFILRAGTIVDHPRLAHALFVAGTIEATHSNAGFGWCKRLLDQSLDAYGSHPFRARALLRKAQCLIRAARLDEATHLLPEVEELLEHVEDPEEHDMVEAELYLARIWVLERKAKDDKRAWRECKSEAHRLQRIAEKLAVTRLELEGLLHLGLAQSHLRERDAAKKHLNEAVSRSETTGFVKIEIASRFALADMLGNGNDDARHHWDEANRLLGGVQSTFLAERRFELSRQFSGLTMVPLNLDQTLPEVNREFTKVYLAHQLKRHPTDRDKLVDAIGKAKATVYRMYIDHGIPLAKTPSDRAPEPEET